jgi:ribosomal protein S18 acetylase RimI-like enzyme
MSITEIDSPLGILRLRPQRDEDREFRFELFCASRPPEWALLPLPAKMHAQLTRHQFEGQTLTYPAQFPNARFDIIELAGERIGRIVTDRSGDKVHLVDQALLPQFRNRRLGSAIMLTLIDEARSAQVPLRLQVALSNQSALRLYLRLGLVQIEATATHLELEWRAPVTPAID